MTKRKSRHCSYNSIRLPVDLWVGDVASLVIAMNLTCVNKQYCLWPADARAKSMWCSQPELAVHFGNELCFLSFTLDKKGMYLKEKMEIRKCLFITLPCLFFPPCPKLLHLQIISKLVSQKRSSHLHGKRKQPRPCESPAIPCCYLDSQGITDWIDISPFRWNYSCTKLPASIFSCFTWNLGWEAPCYLLFMKGGWEEWKTIGMK